MQKKSWNSFLAIVGLLAVFALPIAAQTIENMTPEQKALFLQVIADELATRKEMAKPQVAGAYVSPDDSYLPQSKTLLFVKPQVLGVTTVCGDKICGSGEYYSNCPADCGKGATLSGYKPGSGSSISAPSLGNNSNPNNPCNYNKICEKWRGEDEKNCVFDCSNSSVEVPPQSGLVKCEVCGKWYDPATGKCPDTCNEGEEYNKQKAPITLPAETKDGKITLRGTVSEIITGEPGFIVYDLSQPQNRGSQIGSVGGVQIGNIQSGKTNIGLGSQTGSVSGPPGTIRINVSGFIGATYDKNTKIFSTPYEDETFLPGKMRAYRAAIKVKSLTIVGGEVYIEAKNEQYIYGQAKVVKPGECVCDSKEAWVCYNLSIFNPITKVVSTSTVEYKNVCTAACEITKTRKANSSAVFSFKKNSRCNEESLVIPPSVPQTPPAKTTSSIPINNVSTSTSPTNPNIPSSPKIPSKPCICTMEYAPICAIPPGFTQPQVYPNQCYAKCDSATLDSLYEIIDGKCTYVKLGR